MTSVDNVHSHATQVNDSNDNRTNDDKRFTERTKYIQEYLAILLHCI